MTDFFKTVVKFWFERRFERCCIAAKEKERERKREIMREDQ